MVRISHKCLLESSPSEKIILNVLKQCRYFFVLSAYWFLGVCYIPVQWIMPGEPMALMQSLHRYCNDDWIIHGVLYMYACVIILCKMFLYFYIKGQWPGKIVLHFVALEIVYFDMFYWCTSTELSWGLFMCLFFSCSCWASWKIMAPLLQTERQLIICPQSL